MFRKLYDWMLRSAQSRAAVPIMCFVSFLDSSLFPLPPDLMLIPMCLAQREKAFRLAFICTVASVVGALLGYGIGDLAYETVGKWILSLYGGADHWFAEFQDRFNRYGFWLVVMGGFTPFPFKIITILSGVTHFNLVEFLLACVTARGGRFFLEAAAIKLWGEQVRKLMDQHFEKVGTLFVVLILLGFVTVKFIF